MGKLRNWRIIYQLPAAPGSHGGNIVDMPGTSSMYRSCQILNNGVVLLVDFVDQLLKAITTLLITVFIA